MTERQCLPREVERTAELFEWLQYLAMGTGRKWLNQREAAAALFIGLSCSGRTGEDATIDAERLATEMSVSERQVWRYVESLVDKGWIALSQPAVRGLKGKPGSGRRARYRLTRPFVPMSDQMATYGLTSVSVSDV